MSERFKRQLPNDLEIRGFSRGSIANHPKPDMPMPHNTRSSISYGSMLNDVDQDSDYGDDSTLTGGSQNPPSPGCDVDDTITTGASNFWSAGNSYTTGNTTERSSLYSWDDDEFDHQTSTIVRQMFLAIEQMLYEGVLSGSSSLQQECRQWMTSFPHLRIIGKQVMSSNEEGFQFFPTTSSDHQQTSSDDVFQAIHSSDNISVQGSSMKALPLPEYLFTSMRSTNTSTAPAGFDLSHLNQEIIAEDGKVEELIAYNVTEMEDDSSYHVARRRKLGFPPVTPNACVRDAVLHQLFDQLWSRVITSLHKNNDGDEIEEGCSLLQSLMRRMRIDDEDKADEDEGDDVSDPDVTEDRINQLVSSQYHQVNTFEDGDIIQSMSLSHVTNHHHRRQRMMMISSQSSDDVIQRSHMTQSFVNNSNLPLPPSRGGDHHGGRLSTAPSHQPSSDLNSLKSLMTISQKKLQIRTQHGDELGDLQVGTGSGTKQKRPASSNHLIINNSSSSSTSFEPHPSSLRHQRDIMTSSGVSMRDMVTSAVGRRRVGPRCVGRLQPLDNKRSKSLQGGGSNSASNIQQQTFNGFVRATKLTRPPQLIDGLDQEPPWTSASNYRTPNGGGLWVNSRLPPINNNLESLNENSPLDIKKTRGKTSYTRISSAFVEQTDKSDQNHRVFDNFSRPNTTHSFRVDKSGVGGMFHKRQQPHTSSVVLPPHLNLGAHGSQLAISGFKSTSSLHQQQQHNNTNHTNNNNTVNQQNDRQLTSGITGVGILGSNIILAPIEDVTATPLRATWGSRSSNM